MTVEWDYCVNKLGTLVDDLQVLGAPIPCRCATTMDRNEIIQLRKALNYIWEKNNKMAIQRNRYFMLKELLYTTLTWKSVNPIEVA